MSLAKQNFSSASEEAINHQVKKHSTMRVIRNEMPKRMSTCGLQVAQNEKKRELSHGQGLTIACHKKMKNSFPFFRVLPLPSSLLRYASRINRLAKSFKLRRCTSPSLPGLAMSTRPCPVSRSSSRRALRRSASTPRS